MNASESNEPADPGPSDEPDCPGGHAIALCVDPDSDAPDDPARFADRLQAVADALRLVDPDVTVIVIADDRMARMHEEFSGVEGTTDVLTFDLRDDPLDERDAVATGRAIPGVEGEVYVCIDEARRRAAERGHAPDDELLLYATHGLLHLVGYDDHDEDDYLAMHTREDAVLESIGVGRLFAAIPTPSPQVQSAAADEPAGSTHAIPGPTSDDHPGGHP